MNTCAHENIESVSIKGDGVTTYDYKAYRCKQCKAIAVFHIIRWVDEEECYNMIELFKK